MSKGFKQITEDPSIIDLIAKEPSTAIQHYNQAPGTPKVYQANDVVRSSFKLKLREQRLILCACSKIRKDSKVDEEILITPQDMIKMGYDQKNVYDEMKEATETLYDNEIFIHKENEDVRFRWIQKITYKKDKGRCIGLMFSAPLWPYLNNLSQQFTVIELYDVVGLRTFNAIRMYQMLSSFLAAGQWHVSVHDLKYMLGILNDRDKDGNVIDKYEKFSHFHSRVIKDSCDQINTNPNSKLSVDYSYKKEGRKIVGYVFSISRREAKSTDFQSKSGDHEISLSKAQRKRYALKILTSADWPMYYESVLRPLGLDLHGVQDRAETLAKIEAWLSIKKNATDAYPVLSAVGFRLRK